MILRKSSNNHIERMEALFRKEKAVRDIKIYQSQSSVVAEIWPGEDYLAWEKSVLKAYFEVMRKKWNYDVRQNCWVDEVVLKE